MVYKKTSVVWLLLSTDYHRLSQISILNPNSSRALFPHVSDYSLQRLRFWVPTSQILVKKYYLCTHNNHINNKKNPDTTMIYTTKKRARPGILSWHRLHRRIEKAKSLDSYQQRTLGTSRRHGVHRHTTPFHSTASKATLSLPRRAVLALWESTSKSHFYIFTFLHFYREMDFYA